MSTQQAILVLDDDRNLARVVQAGLEQAGYAVWVAHDVDAGLEHLLRRCYDLILLDSRLVHLEGTAALPVLRAASPPETAFVILTTSDEPGMRVQALRAGAHDVFVKPFELAELLAGVRSTMSGVARSVASTGLLPVGARVGIRLPHTALELSCRIVDARGDTFTVGCPGIPAAAAGAYAVALVYSQDGIYEFRTRVEAAGDDLATLSKPTTIRRHQRRRHERWPLPVPCVVRLLQPDSEAPAPFHGIGRDVSLGGMSLASPHGVEPGRQVELTLSPAGPDAAEFRADATITRSERASVQDRLVVYSLGARFHRLTAQQQDQLGALLHPHVRV